jgi:hypothetical protein
VEGDLVTVRVPLDYQGVLGIAIGRRVRPGEHYESAAISAQLPGEASARACRLWHARGQGFTSLFPPHHRRARTVRFQLSAMVR